ncbi:hypothetical protein UNDYM_4491 [Undibacterium sp. YM2]|nr:hypothetical protein UNDYM_4491 [Undibacterium sp. YM2]
MDKLVIPIAIQDIKIDVVASAGQRNPLCFMWILKGIVMLQMGHSDSKNYSIVGWATLDQPNTGPQISYPFEIRS